MRWICLLLLAAMPAWAQVNQGELRLKVVGPSGGAMRATAELACSGTGYDQILQADAAGRMAVDHLAFGEYHLRVWQRGFAPALRNLEVDSALPREETVQLGLAALVTEVKVRAVDPTLIDPEHNSSAMQIGSRQIEQRLASLPGRSLQDLIVTQPGWLYEGNAVLHPRGAEYQTQFVIDGIPLTDNRSPSFGPEIGANELQSMAIYTAGFPAEYGRKLGGVVALETRQSIDAGLHGQLVTAGGSYDTRSVYGDLNGRWGSNFAGLSAASSSTGHYLNPVVPQNFTNHGTAGDFSGQLQRDVSARDRVSLSIRHAFSSYQVPNELLQQQAGQLQGGANAETMLIAHYQHIVPADTLVALAGMLRDHTNGLTSNAQSTPILAFQRNSFREGYFTASISQHLGHHELKAGVESDATFLREHFHYAISNFRYFDSSTPPSLSFTALRPDLEQGAFVEDQAHFGNWSISAGLRWDHYQLLLNRSALSPRLSISRFFPALHLGLHASYDRVFQTPSFENILLSSSQQVDALNSNFLRLPVRPSLGNYYEGGVIQSIFGRVRLDGNAYRREERDCGDDDQLLNTGISYPVSFEKCVIYGAEGKLTLADMGRLSGYASYSYMVGADWFPVTGGLFLGDDASAVVAQVRGHFPATQDQRNTVATRFAYQLTRRMWLAAGGLYGSGLPFDFRGSEAQALAEYGPAVVSRINFNRGRVRPQLSVDGTVGTDLYEGSKMNLRLQADGENLTNRLNVIDFGGLFSGNAIGPARTVMVRLSASF